MLITFPLAEQTDLTPSGMVLTFDLIFGSANFEVTN
ncbi:MAG: hypothetical protein BWX62_00466 [Bacteroidetes bacterium ADurb.Bin037]|nr:MAG: hypothetical protein BWX62_00466 [Bacteroidetes bacterium ADurb.Bin037]